MKKSQLSNTQLRDVNVFNLLLEYNGWDDCEDTEYRLDSGEHITPEGCRTYTKSGVILESKFHAPVNMISLAIIDAMADETVQFHFLFEDRPERILEWITEIQADLTLQNYPELLKTTKDRCEMILLEVSETEIYEVKPSAQA
ncbi:MAG: hypothetical protein AAF399_24320 [Bacteroidota bacterium]